MSFWDNVKKFAKPYSDEDDYSDDYEDEVEETYEEEETPARAGRRPSPFEPAKTAEPAPAARPAATGAGFSGQVLNMNSGRQEVVLFHAKSFDDAAKAADELRKKKAVILNMENVDKALIRRVVDFLSGSIYALDGSVKKVAQATYLFCPHNMEVVGDLENLQADSQF